LNKLIKNRNKIKNKILEGIFIIILKEVFCELQLLWGAERKKLHEERPKFELCFCFM